jgi:hypothetical protein
MLLNYPFLRHFFTLSKAVALVFLTLMSCSEEPEELIRPQQNTLQAQAGNDQNVFISTEVILDASESKSDNGTSFDLKWTLKSKPQSSTAVISNATSVLSSFTPDKSGIYTISLTISQGEFSDVDEMRVIVTSTDNPNDTQVINANITEERFLEDVFSDTATPDYIVTADIRVTANLTIQPGVIIEFEEDKGMQVMAGGAIVAEGSENQPIIFTGVEKQTGFWKGLAFASNSSLNNLQYTIVEYGGSSEFPESPKANISVPGDAFSGSVLRISNSIIRNSGAYGIYAGGMSSIPEFVDMVVTNNIGTAIYCSPKNISHIDPHTEFYGNGFNGVATGGVLNEGDVVSWYPLSSGSYQITSDLTVASKLLISAGAVFKMSKNVLITVAPGAFFSVNGTAGSPVVFEGSSTISDNGWRGILLQSGAESLIDYAVVKNAGVSDLPNMAGIRANITVATGAGLTITNSLIEKSSGWGIALNEGSFYNDDILTGNTFVAMQLGSVKFPTASQPTNIAVEWVDFPSLIANRSIDENYYNWQTGQWFGGAANPWAMTQQTAFGLKVDASGNYTWIIAVQHSPMTECFTYSAEHFTGHVTANAGLLNFVEESWRSKYVNSCTPEENKDIEVQPGGMQLPYEIVKEYHPGTGQEYFVLTITSGGESFKLYKK